MINRAAPSRSMMSSNVIPYSFQKRLNFFRMILPPYFISNDRFQTSETVTPSEDFNVNAL